jgi:hypothetical protein
LAFGPFSSHFDATKMDTNGTPKKLEKLRIELSQYLLDHRLKDDDHFILPGSTILLHSLGFNPRIPWQNGAMIFEDIILLKPIIIPREQARQWLQLWQSIEPNLDESLLIKIFTDTDTHEAVLDAKLNHQTSDFLCPDHSNGPFSNAISSAEFNDFMHRECGYNYGPAFQSVRRLEYGLGFEDGHFCAWGKCELFGQEGMHEGRLDIQLDALWQAMVFCRLKEEETTQDGIGKRQQLVPAAIGRLQICRELREAAKMYFSIRLDGPAIGNCWIKMSNDDILLMAEGILFRPMAIPSIERPLPLDIGTIIDANEGDKVLIRSIACRLPGGVNSPDEFWTLLCEGRTTDEAIPAWRIPEKDALIKGEYNGGNVPGKVWHFFL